MRVGGEWGAFLSRVFIAFIIIIIIIIGVS